MTEAMTYEEYAKATPANVEAERAFLGSLFIDPDLIYSFQDKILPTDFFRQSHGWVYEAMLATSKRGLAIDFVTVMDQLERTEKLEDVGGPAFITDLISGTPTSMYAEHYAAIVKDTSMRRGLIVAAGAIAKSAYSGKLADESLVDAYASIAKIESRQTKEIEFIKKYIEASVVAIDTTQRTGVVQGIKSGFTMLDRMLGGFRPGKLYTLAARPGMGKSALALNIATYVAKQKKRVLFVSLEMEGEELTNRLLSTEAGIPMERLTGVEPLDTTDWTIILEAANMIAEMPIALDIDPVASVASISAKARKMVADEGLDLIIIDYMQIMSASNPRQDRQQQISEISRGLKALGMSLHLPVIALSQLSRKVEERTDKRPMLSDLRESGAIEQDSDAVLFIYREDYYDEETDRQNIADIIIAKHRGGRTGTISLYFRKDLTQFRDLELQRTELEY